MKEKRFDLISLIATYVYLKEKYNDVDKGLKETSSEDLGNIVTLLKPLEKFLAIPDKKSIVKKSFNELSAICLNNIEGQETAFLSKVNEYAEGLSIEEKAEILNIIMYVTDEDSKISEKEKEVILQIAYTLGIEDDYNKLLMQYKKSPLKRTSTNLGVIAFIVAMVLLVGGFAFYQFNQKSSDVVNVFKDKKVVFNQVFFNRFVIYKNKANVNNEHFKKQAVFYVAGDAEVSFDPSDVKYDPTTKIVTYFLPKDEPFKVDMNNIKPLLVDETKPVPLSEKEAAVLATGLGIAGGILGSKAGGALGSLYPHPLGKIGGSVIGAGVAGIGTGIVSFNVFNGLQISKSISRKEKAEVSDKSIDLINAILTYNSDLTQEYKEAFVKYIKRKYALYGKDVVKIEFDDKRIAQ